MTDSIVLNYSWVPCNVRFPDETKTYLVTVEKENGDRIVTDMLFSTVYGWCGMGENAKIHAWLPMPKVYEYDGHEDFHVKTIEEMMADCSNDSE